MTKKIFRSFLLTTLLTLAVSMFFVFGILYQYFEEQLMNDLKSKAVFISHAVESEGADYLERIGDVGERVTLIAPDGTVIADTEANAAEMENHLERSEVKQAAENGSGTSVRYSETLTEKIIYYAVKMPNGNILRVSVKHYTVITILLGLVQPILVTLLIAAVLCFVLSSKLSKSIVKPINSLDLDAPENNDAYEELAPLLKKISRQRRIIDEQLQTAKRLQEEFRLITENMSEGFLVINRERNVLTHNSAALRLLKISEPPNGNVLAVNRSEPFRNAVERALSGERSENEMMFGESCYGIIANPVLNDGEVIGAVIIILDVTERVRREQLRREFTANVSHELKTPLTSISGFAEMMVNGVPDDIAADFARSIYDEAQRLIVLVGDIIKLSELDENSARLEQERVDLRELSEDVAKRLGLAAENKNVAVTVIGNAQITGVRKILDEMIFNLCDNAIKYNKNGGSADIVISSDAEKHTVTLTVRDTGIGIPGYAQNRVFERFYRVDKGRSKSAGGTGLGLAIVKHGAACHNAEIHLKSEENKGTEISIIFPDK
jgi:two-component system phosphate regulon sensor histidine kinase PhoR